MSRWRGTFKVHPSADKFPMMSEEEIDALAADIKANGLREVPTWAWDNDLLLDGRNRLEAIERAGFDLDAVLGGRQRSRYPGDPVAFIISKNIHRRHLTKQQQADLIVAAMAADKLTKVQSVSKGGKGKVNPIKQGAIAEGKKHGISEGTMKASLAKANPKPKPKPKAMPKEGSDEYERDRRECIALFQKVQEAEQTLALAKSEGRKPKPKAIEPDELPNIGCNFDPADPRGYYKDDDTKIVRRRAWLHMAHHAVEQARSFLAEGDHRAIAVADADEINVEVLLAASDAAAAWKEVLEELLDKSGLTKEFGQALVKREQKRASTLKRQP